MTWLRVKLRNYTHNRQCVVSVDTQYATGLEDFNPVNSDYIWLNMMPIVAVHENFFSASLSCTPEARQQSPAEARYSGSSVTFSPLISLRLFPPITFSFHVHVFEFLYPNLLDGFLQNREDFSSHCVFSSPVVDKEIHALAIF